jgi:hypothetical protein
MAGGAPIGASPNGVEEEAMSGERNSSSDGTAASRREKKLKIEIDRGSWLYWS